MEAPSSFQVRQASNLVVSRYGHKAFFVLTVSCFNLTRHNTTLQSMMNAKLCRLVKTGFYVILSLILGLKNRFYKTLGLGLEKNILQDSRSRLALETKQMMFLGLRLCLEKGSLV